jgi:hypothetical protein
LEKSESMLGFKLMSLVFKLRDLLLPRINVLKEVGIKPDKISEPIVALGRLESCDYEEAL